MKNNLGCKEERWQCSLKLPLRSLVIVILCSTITALAQDTSTNKLVSIARTNVPLKEILNDIEQQTGLTFFYNTQLIDVQKPASLNVTNEKLSTALDKLFSNGNILYKIMGSQIAVYIGNKQTGANNAGEISSAAATNTNGNGPLKLPDGKTVAGTIKDGESGEPLPYVLVFVKNHKNLSVITGDNGHYSITVPQPATDTLVFSYMGYRTQEISVRNRSVINTTMQVENQLLEEVVITGYQKIRKEQMTGSVAMVDADVIKQQISTDGNIASSMEGKLAGLYVDPLNPNEVQIRGVSTFNAVNSPLIVIDGFPSELKLSEINPNDIVSISLLKDAAASAIYGVRASNGVIVIVTKKGSDSGKTMFSLQTSLGVQPKPDIGYLGLVRGNEYVEAQRRIIAASLDKRSNYTVSDMYYSQIHAAQFDLNEGLITEEQAAAIFRQIGAQDNKDEYEELFYQNRISRQVDFTMNGGNEKATYFLGLNYLHNDLLVKGANTQKVTVSMKGDYKINKVFNANASIFYGNQQNENKYAPSLTMLLPYERLRDNNGNALPTLQAPFYWRATSIDPQANQALIDAGFYDFNYYPYDEYLLNTSTNSTNNIRLQGTLQAKLIEGITLEAGGAYEKFFNKRITINDKNSFYLRSIANSHLEMSDAGSILFGIPYGDMYSDNRSESSNYTIRLQLNIDKTIAEKHNIFAIAGAEQRMMVSEGSLATMFGYDEQSLITLPVNIEKLTTTEWTNHLQPIYSGLVSTSPLDYNSLFGASYTDNRFVSFYANAAYTFDRRYVLTGSFRIDQSNLFGTDPQYRYKPLWSAGVSWNAKNESFLEDVDWLDLMKVRLSTGFNGNIAKNNGPFILTQTAADSRVPNIPMYDKIISPKNESLRWEQTMNYNAGIDLSFFDNRLSITAEYYYKYSTDVLGYTIADPTSGFSSLMQNYAEISNNGFDLSLESVNVRTGNFQWRSNFTGSINNNNVEKTKETEYAFTFSKVQSRVVTEGYPYDALFSYDFRGLNEKGQPLVNDGTGSIVAYTYPTTSDIPQDALVYSGSIKPKYTIGFSNTLSYANFDFYFMFLFNGGHVMRTPAPVPSTWTLYEGAENFWMNPGDELVTDVPGYNYKALNYGDDGWFSMDALSAYQYAQSRIRRADYVKLKEVVLTYSLPKEWLQKFHIDAFRLRFQINNLWYYTFSGNDINPEAINPVTGTKTIPITPTYTFGLSLNF